MQKYYKICIYANKKRKKVKFLCVIQKKTVPLHTYFDKLGRICIETFTFSR